MTRLQGKRISKRTVDALPVDGRDAVYWDPDLKGFGVRVYPSGSKVFVVQCRSQGKLRRITLGAHGLITADQARRKAARTLVRLKGVDAELPTALAPSTRGIESTTDPDDWSSEREAASPVHRRVLSRIVRRFDRSVMSNSHRATYAECLVSELLAPDWTPPWGKGHDRAPWDLQHPTGTWMKIEQSALLRPWPRGQGFVRRQTPRFDIAPPKGFWTIDDVWIDKPGHRANIHVFAWHGVDNGSVTDQREPDQWQFFVVPTSSLPEDQPHIDLDGLEEMTDAVGYQALRFRVHKVVAELQARNAED